MIEELNEEKESESNFDQYAFSKDFKGSPGSNLSKPGITSSLASRNVDKLDKEEMET